MRKCGFCGRDYPVSDRVFEESPFCALCLHERVAQATGVRDLPVRAKLDAALRAWPAHAPKVDCAAHNEGLSCCIDHDHENYRDLLDFVASRLG